MRVLPPPFRQTSEGFTEEGGGGGGRRPVGPVAHPSGKGGGGGGRIHKLFFFFSLPRYGSLEGTSWFYAAACGSPPREYGGWDCTGERGRDGDMPEMVKGKQRRASSLMKCRDSLCLCRLFPEALEILRMQLIRRGAESQQRFPVSSMEQVCFFLMHTEGVS